MTKEVVALDCEMVGVGASGNTDLLARVSVVDKDGEVLYDSFVKPRNNVKITNYRTDRSGIRAQDLVTAPTFEVAQNRVKSLLRGRIVVGHDISSHDLAVLDISHPHQDIRDTALYPPFKIYARPSRRFVPKPGLKVLSQKFLGQSIQRGEHSSVEDARTTMKIYMLHRTEWEQRLGNRTS